MCGAAKSSHTSVVHEPTADLLREAQEIIEDAGVHPAVPAVVTRVESAETAVALHVTLHYRTAHPVCCSMPDCHVPFLKRDGLADIAESYQRRRGMLIAPEVTIVVTPAFEPEFQFIERDLFRPDPTPRTFTRRYE